MDLSHEGERLRLRIVNQTMMFHLIHVHGHTFQMVGDGSARKDTVKVLPMTLVEIDIVADNPGHWSCTATTRTTWRRGWRPCSPTGPDCYEYRPHTRSETDMAVVLVVDDEVRIRELVRRYLEHEGHQVLTAGSGAEALEIAGHTTIDLIVLDLRLPDITGEQVATEIRKSSDVPILMLTAKVDERDRIHGLEVGADDYVLKPFSPRELVLRVGAILRRGRTSTVDAAAESFGGGALTIDEATRRVTVNGESVELTPTEWGVLLALAAQPGRVCSRYELINRVRGYEFDGYERTVDSHVKNLRRKIEPDPTQPTIVQTVTGVGYRLGLDRDR